MDFFHNRLKFIYLVEVKESHKNHRYLNADLSLEIVSLMRSVLFKIGCLLESPEDIIKN